MSQLKLFLFGTPRIEVNGTAVNLQRRKSMALFIYLLVMRRPQRRDALVAMLWPESGQRAARASLRRELHHLNQAIGDGWLNPTRDTIDLVPDAAIWLDIEEFQQKIEMHFASNAGALSEEDLTALTVAAELYQADFMAGFTLSDSPDFDEWQFFQGDALRLQFARLLQTLIAYHTGESQYDEAIDYARRWLALDYMHESAHRELMRFFALAGQQAAAVRQYDECVRILDEELGVPPEDETTKLYEAIRTRRFPSRDKMTRRQDDQMIETSSHLVIQSSGHPFDSAQDKPVPKHNLPTQPTSFIGREDELVSIRQLLLAEDECRLLTLIGPGGIGKTRLSIEAASGALDTYPDGIYFVPLVSVEDAGNIFTTIAEAMRFGLQGGDEPKAQLCNFLSARKILFILDNFEHLLGGAIAVSEVLRAAPNVSVMVTSREALGLQEEWLYPVSGMGLPADADALSAVETNAAIQLFVERARRVEATFTITEETKPHLVRICRAVDGLPLGLELAASWLRALSCEEIADEITRNLDLLETNLRNIPERHRSVRVIFEQTWQQLSARERAILSALSLFRGGCTRDAASKVVGASLSLIVQLVDKSLLQHTANGRYQMHELFRQFAFEQLQERPDEHAQLLRSLSDYFTDYLSTHRADLEGGRQRQVLREIVADINNIRLAWQTAIDHKNLTALWNAAESLCIFTDMHCNYLDGIAMFGNAIDALTKLTSRVTEGPANNQGNADGSQATLVAVMQVMQGFLWARAAHWKHGVPLIEEGIAYLRAEYDANHHAGERVDNFILGRALMRQSHLFPNWQEDVVAELERKRAECISLAESVNDRWCIASCLYFLGNTLHWSGHGNQAVAYLEECLHIFQELDDVYRIHRPYLNLGVIANNHGDYRQALAYFAQGIRLSQASNNLVDEAFILAMSVDAHIALGDVNAALEAGRAGDQILTELGLVQHQKVRGNLLASALRANGQLEEAEKLHFIALERAEEVGEEFIIADTCRRLSWVEWERLNYQKAEAYLTRSLALSRKNDNTLLFVYSLRDLGLMLIDADAECEEEIRTYFQEALQLALALALAPVAMDLFLGIGILQMRKGQVDAALALLSFVEQHSASAHTTKEKARVQLSTIEKEALPHAIDAVGSRPSSSGWQAVAQQLIIEGLL